MLAVMPPQLLNLGLIGGNSAMAYFFNFFFKQFYANVKECTIFGFLANSDAIHYLILLIKG